MAKDPKDMVQEIIQLVGKQRARKLLILEDASTSTAIKLVEGTYPYTPGALIAAAIKRAREKAIEEASRAS